jgi:hypothetical protein
MPSIQRSASSGLTRQVSTSSGSRNVDWRTYLTVEERLAVRGRINEAYLASCTTYEQLMETVMAIEEELMYLSAPSRLDYFKSGLQFDGRVANKKKQLENAAEAEGEEGSEAEDGEGSEAEDGEGSEAEDGEDGRGSAKKQKKGN